MTDRLIQCGAAGTVQETVKLPSAGAVTLGCGSDSGTTFCVTHDDLAFVSPRFPDLTCYATYRDFTASIDGVLTTLGLVPAVVAHDLHPDYCSTRYATHFTGVDFEPVQHHHAHTAACMVENGLDGKVIGVAFDGMGLGTDGTLWGGEFLVCSLRGFRRAVHLKQYALPGGDQATLHPERFAFSCLLSELGGNIDAASRLLPGIDPAQADTLARMLRKGVRSPLTSSAGRLFDAVSALLGFRGAVSSPGEAAIQLQSLAAAGVGDLYPFGFDHGVIDFAAMFRDIVSDIGNGVDRGRISAMFHNTLAAAGADVCERLAEEESTRRVTLSGGVFMNRLLRTLITEKLHSRGLQVYTHSLLQPGDACVSLGQVAVAMAKRSGRR